MHPTGSPYAPNATPLPASFADSETGNTPRLVIEVAEPAVRARATPVSLRLSLPPTALAIAATNMGPVQVRALFPACLVSPADVTLDAVHSPAATLWLTPLGAEPHFDGTFDVLANGQTIQRLPLRLSANHSRLGLKFALAAIAAPILWWAISAADGNAVSAAIRLHVPAFGGITAAIANAAQRAVELAGPVEHSFRIGFWLAIGLAVAAVASRWLSRPKTRKITGDPLAGLVASPSARMRKLPPYLTPVSPEELAHRGP